MDQARKTFVMSSVDGLIKYIDFCGAPIEIRNGKKNHEIVNQKRDRLDGRPKISDEKNRSRRPGNTDSRRAVRQRHSQTD